MATQYIATPYAAIWDPATANLTLVQKGTCIVSIERTYTDVMDNDHGDAVIEMISRGIKSCEITVPITDCQLSTIFAMNPLCHHFTNNGERVEFRPNIGAAASAYAKKLILKKMENGVPSTDETTWITATKAVPITTMKLNLGNEQVVWETVFKCFPDSANNERYIFFGDEAAS